jgi:hypothetical protein
MLKNITLLLIPFAFGCLVMGCTLTQEHVVSLAQKVVKQYCDVPEAERLLIRGQVNQAIAPASILVTCPPAPPVGP